MFCSLVLLIKTINTFVICIWGYISFISRNIDIKNKWLRLRWLRQRLAEAETETSHLKDTVYGPRAGVSMNDRFLCRVHKLICVHSPEHLSRKPNNCIHLSLADLGEPITGPGASLTEKPLKFMYNI